MACRGTASSAGVYCTVRGGMGRGLQDASGEQAASGPAAATHGTLGLTLLRAGCPKGSSRVSLSMEVAGRYVT